MKKYINKKKYDTDTAKKLGEVSRGAYGSLEYEEESLYLTKSGNYFLYAWGGANSKYAEETSKNSWSGGSMIQPLSLSAAQNWAEKNLSGDVYESIFGEQEDEEGAKETLIAYVSPSCKRTLNTIKQETGKTLGQIIEEKFKE